MREGSGLTTRPGWRATSPSVIIGPFEGWVRFGLMSGEAMSTRSSISLGGDTFPEFPAKRLLVLSPIAVNVWAVVDKL